MGRTPIFSGTIGSLFVGVGVSRGYCQDRMFHRMFHRYLHRRRQRRTVREMPGNVDGVSATTFRWTAPASLSVLARRIWYLVHRSRAGDFSVIQILQRFPLAPIRRTILPVVYRNQKRHQDRWIYRLDGGMGGV